MEDRASNVYDVVKIAYDTTEQNIKNNVNMIMERELIICEENTSLYTKLNGKLFKVKLEEVM